MNEKILTTQGRGREVAQAKKGDSLSLSIHELEDGRLKMDDRSYVLKFGKPEDFARVREAIEDRRKREPAFSYWRCAACGWTAKMRGDKQEGGPCLRCNIQNLIGGGFLRKMTPVEAEEWEKTEAENWKRINEREAAARLYEINQGREKAGLPRFTREELEAADAADWKAKLEWQKQENERLKKLSEARK
jgi:hypothetical protein